MFSGVVVESIDRFGDGDQFHSRTRFPNRDLAVEAFKEFNGRCIYHGCCQLDLFLESTLRAYSSSNLGEDGVVEEMGGPNQGVAEYSVELPQSSDETKNEVPIDMCQEKDSPPEIVEFSVLQGVPYEPSNFSRLNLGENKNWVDNENQNAISAIMDERIHMEGDIDDSIEDAGQESDNEEAKIIQSDQPEADSIRGTEFSMGLIPNVLEILITANNVSGQVGNGNLVGRTCLATVELTVDDAWVRKNSVEMNAPKVFEEMSYSGIDVMSRDSWNLDPGGLVSRDVRSADVGLIPMSEYSHSYHLVFGPGGGLDCEASADSFIDIEISSEQRGCIAFSGIAYYDLRLIKNGQNSLPFDRGRVAIDIVEPQEDSKAVTMNFGMGSNVSKVIPGSLKAIVVEVTPQEMPVPCFWKIPIGYNSGVANKLISVLDYGDISTLLYVESSCITDLVDKHWVLGANWIFDSGRGLPLTLVGWIQFFFCIAS